MTYHVVLAAAVAMAAGLGDGRSFVRMGGDLSRGVLVNLTPGAPPGCPPHPHRATVVFVHGWNPAPRTVHFTMAEQFAGAIAGRGGLGLNVLAWNWNAATSPSLLPRVNAERAVAQGVELAGALLAHGLDPARIHLIGHSSGGIVAASAARVLARQTARRVAHLTLLEAAAFYHPLVFDELAAGSWSVHVENYWAPAPSGYGRAVAHANVASVMVPGPTPYFGVVNPLRSNHLHVVAWYIGTVQNSALPAGFNRSVLLANQSW